MCQTAKAALQVSSGEIRGMQGRGKGTSMSPDETHDCAFSMVSHIALNLTGAFQHVFAMAVAPVSTALDGPLKS